MIEFKDSSFMAYASRVEGVDPREVFPAHLDVMRAFLAGIRESEASHRYAPGKWSVRQVVGHLADVHLVFGYRMVSLARGEAKPLPGMDEEQYMEAARFDDLPFSHVTATWRNVSAAFDAFSAGIPASAWDRQGTANGVRLSARQMLAALIGHEIHHIGVLKERYGLG